MIRIITARYLARLKGANERHQTAHAIKVREIEGLKRQVDAAIERQGQLTAENALLRQQAKALDERLAERQLADEAADRAATS
jgi:regulator of replication initiation timing